MSDAPDIVTLQSRLEQAERDRDNYKYMLSGFMDAAAVQLNVGGEVTIFGWDQRQLTAAYRIAYKANQKEGA